MSTGNLKTNHTNVCTHSCRGRQGPGLLPTTILVQWNPGPTENKSPEVISQDKGLTCLSSSRGVTWSVVPTTPTSIPSMGEREELIPLESLVPEMCAPLLKDSHCKDEKPEGYKGDTRKLVYRKWPMGIFFFLRPGSTSNTNVLTLVV